MKIPERLKIGAHTFTVLIRDLGEKQCGQTDLVKQTISIDSELTGTMLVTTLIHEIFHVMNTELEHVLLDSLAQQLTQVLLDNDLLKLPEEPPVLTNRV
jgi:hypothetical protein